MDELAQKLPIAAGSRAMANTMTAIVNMAPISQASKTVRQHLTVTICLEQMMLGPENQMIFIPVVILTFPFPLTRRRGFAVQTFQDGVTSGEPRSG